MKTFLHYILVFALLLGFENASAKTSTAAVSSDASLKSIVLSTATTLVFSTGPANYNYTTSVDPSTTQLSVEPTANDPTAKVTVNGVVVPYGSSSAQITLNGIVTTTINMVSISSDLTDTLTYSIVVYETGSNDAFLSALSISTGNTLVASGSSPGVYNYTTSVSPATTSVTVTPTVVDPTATITVNGVAVASGMASSPPITLNAVGTTTINTVVLAQDGFTTQTYSIVVSKNGSNISTLSALSVSTNSPLFTSTGSSNFSASNLNYTALVSNATTTLTVTPTTTDPGSTVTVNGVAVTSGSPSGAVAINAAGTTVITIVVTAQDHVTKSTYTITVSKNASGVGNTAAHNTPVLSTNSVLTFGSGTYTTSVAAGTTSLTVTITTTDPNASILINGASTSSGVASGAVALNTSGVTSIPVVITSSDGSAKSTFSIAVSQNGGNNAGVTSIDVFDITTNTPATLVGAGSPYTCSINTSSTSASLTVNTIDPNATVTISIGGVVQKTGTGGAVSFTINPLNAQPGPTTVTSVVTAQDGVTKGTYVVSISQTGSTNANVNSIALSPSGFLINSTSGSANYNAGYHANYNSSVSPSATTVAVTATLADANAVLTISVNGGAAVTATSGVPYTVTLTPSSTFILVKVVSASSTVTNLFGITVYPNGSNNANIVFPPGPPGLSLSTGTTLTSVTGTNNYTTIVSPNTNTVTVTATTQDANAKLSVNGLTAVSGSPSNPITLNTTGTTSISILCTAEDGHTTKTYVITVSRSGLVYTWTGGSSTSWSTKSNWSPSTGVPGPGDVASFTNAAVANQPAITVNGTVVGELDFGTNTTLTLTHGQTFTVGTNLTVSSGATAIIKSDVVNNAAIMNITSTATVNVIGTGVLNISSTSPVTFTLKSTAASSASVGQLSSSTAIVGMVTVERYIQGGSVTYRGYRLLSSPVYAATVVTLGVSNNVYSINYIKTTSFFTGFGGTTNGFDNSTSNNPSLYLFREDVPFNNYSFTGGNYSGISKINNATAYNYYVNGGATTYNISVGNGFFFFYRGDRTVTNNKFSSATAAESTVMSTTGFLNQGQIVVRDWFTPTSSSLSYTTTVANAGNRGLNLVGNPYASSIDWDTYNTTLNSNTGIDAVNVGSAIYILDPVSKNYGVYMANSAFGGTNNATHVIPSGQGFFVQASSAGASLTFNEDAKIAAQVTGANLLLGTPVANNTIGRYLHIQLNQNSVEADEIYISFNSSAKSQFVIGEDAAQKPGFGGASLASMSSDGIPLSINTLPLPGQSETIALNVNSVSDGTYQLAIPEIKGIPTLYDVWLMDAMKKDSVDIRQSLGYTFTINKSDASSFGANRFSLVIRQNPALGMHLLNFTAAKSTGGAQITWKTSNEQNYTNFTVERSTDNGKTFEVLGGFLSSDGGTYSYLDKNPLITTDQYRLKLEDVNGAISYSKVVPLLYSTLSDNIVNSSINVYPNPTHGLVKLAINQNTSSSGSSGMSALQTLSSGPALVNDQTESTQSYNIKIFSITGTIVKTATSSSPTWQDNLSSLSPGTYIVQVLNRSDNSLIGKTTFVKL